MEIEKFFSDVGGALEVAHTENIQACRDFFVGLKPPLDAARALERELNRHLAHRFNSLAYLRTDELGLSKIIADLLDPQASHGQGSLFLQLLLEKLELTESWEDLQLSESRVNIEYDIPSGRIDIHVEFENQMNESYCLAFENKPYAADQHGQVSSYLEYLEERFEKRFLLIYLSSGGEPPTEKSLSIKELRNWVGRLSIMSYHEIAQAELEEQTDLDEQEEADKDDSKDPYSDFQASFSFTSWLRECYHRCEAEKLRWFLRDVENFCKPKFGGSHMISDGETRAIKEFLTKSPEHLVSAQSVVETWPVIRHEVICKFLHHLRARVDERVKAELPEYLRYIEVGCHTTAGPNESAFDNLLWIYLYSWHEHSNSITEILPRNAIVLQASSYGKRFESCSFGVRSGNAKDLMTDDEARKRNLLADDLKKELKFDKQDKWWVAKKVDEKYENWGILVPELALENTEKKSEITSYFVDKLVTTAKLAIPIIDKVEDEWK